MGEGVSESRFYMWRAVFAMAHADHVVTDEERNFMEQYLNNVPFSEEQKDILRTDMAEPQEVNEMFFMITTPEDQGEFFQFARELIWCDGDLAAQEESIKERLKADQLSRMNVDRMQVELDKSRAQMKMERTAESREMKEKAEGIVGLGSFLRGMVKGERP